MGVRMRLPTGRSGVYAASYALLFRQNIAFRLGDRCHIRSRQAFFWLCSLDRLAPDDIIACLHLVARGRRDAYEDC